jgi:hypothetical protein
LPSCAPALASPHDASRDEPRAHARQLPNCGSVLILPLYRTTSAGALSVVSSGVSSRQESRREKALTILLHRRASIQQVKGFLLLTTRGNTATARTCLWARGPGRIPRAPLGLEQRASSPRSRRRAVRRAPRAASPVRSRGHGGDVTPRISRLYKCNCKNAPLAQEAILFRSCAPSVAGLTTQRRREPRRLRKCASALSLPRFPAASVKQRSFAVLLREGKRGHVRAPRAVSPSRSRGQGGERHAANFGSLLPLIVNSQNALLAQEAISADLAPD